MAERHEYRTLLRWEGQRKGILGSPGLPELAVATPPEFPGGHPGVWSPEHLFVASVEVCIMTTFLAIAENSKLEFRSYASSAVGILEKTESGFRITQITVRPRVAVAEAGLRDRVLRVMEKSERACLISNSMKATVRLETEIVVEE
jgi:organic hydroperoxide reductase OsmC/OhrA